MIKKRNKHMNETINAPEPQQENLVPDDDMIECDIWGNCPANYDDPDDYVIWLYEDMY